MKHIKLFEDFDLDKFLENPGKEMADDGSDEINIGNYVNSYRGKGRVVDIDDDFATVELHNSKGNTVKVPVFALTKIQSADIDASPVRDTEAELKNLVDQAEGYSKAFEMSGRVNIESLLSFIQDTVVEVITIKDNDTAYDRYTDYYKLIDLVGALANIIQTERPDLADEVDAALENFPS
jgi:hypothetical protein